MSKKNLQLAAAMNTKFAMNMSATLPPAAGASLNLTEARKHGPSAAP